MRRLEGKVAVVTGSSRGFGLAIARAYLREGASVVVTSRSEAGVSVALSELDSDKAVGHVCDVGSLAAVRTLRDRALERFGHLDIWVNNAGLAGVYGPTVEVAPSEYMRVVNANILGVYHGSLVAMRHFLPLGRGKLINLLGRGDKRPVSFQNAYAPSKAWVRSFTLGLAGEHRDSGVGVFALNPGLLRTGLLQQVDVVSGYEDRLKAMGKIIRMWAVEPAEAAELAVRLASSWADGKTGIELQAFGPAKALAGLARDNWQRFRGTQAPTPQVTLRHVPKDDGGFKGDPDPVVDNGRTEATMHKETS